MSELDLWLYGTPIASVAYERRSRARLTFRDEAIDRWGLGSRILTVAEPLTPDTLPPARTAVILEGLLPEGEARERLEALFEARGAELLAVLGRETLGAVMAFPGGERPSSYAGTPVGQPLSESDIALRIRGLRGSPLGVSPEAQVRISLAGAQPKLPLHMKNGEYFDPSFGNPSTVILKPEQPAWPRLVELEAWGLDVMRAAGVPVPEWEVATFEGINTLVVQRYDREWEGDRVIRIHQEDLCMALGVGPDKKYATSRNSPTSLRALAEVIYRNSNDPKRDLGHFLRVVITNIAIGNCDGHARNFGLIHLEDGTVQFAPAYDIVPTYHYTSHDRTFSQTINGQQMRPESVKWDHLSDEVGAWNVGDTRLLLEVAVSAVRLAVENVGPPSDSPNLKELLARVDRLET